MSKYTPGPWFTKREGFSTVYVEARIGGGLVQEVAACGPTEAGQEQQEANARLIAAAPELLAALIAMEARFGCRSSRAEDQPKTFACHHMAETCPNCEGLVTGWKAVQAALAAIAKATGEQL